MSASEKPDFVLETKIDASPEAIWNALTQGELTRQYFMMDAELSGTVAVGERYLYTASSGNPMLAGEYLEVKPFSRLAMTFEPRWSDTSRDPAPPSHNVYEIKELDRGSLLTIQHFGITPATEGAKEGWTKIAANLKAMLEDQKATA